MNTTEVSIITLDTINSRTQEIKDTQQQLVYLWYLQGRDLIKAMGESSCTQEELSNIFSLSKGSVSIYIKLAKDTRIEEILNPPHQMGIESQDKRLERFNQKQLVKLTTLNDVEFSIALQDGKLPSIPTEKAEEILFTNIEQIKFIESKINELNKELDELKQKEVKNDEVIIDAVVIENDTKRISNHSNQKKKVSQIDIKSGEVVATFESLAIARIKTGFSQSSISKCCSGKQTKAHGFIWRYI